GAAVAYVTAAIEEGIGVENFTVGTGSRHADAISFANDRRCVDGDDHVLARVAIGHAHERKDALRRVLIVDPRKSCRLGIEPMERRSPAINTVAVAYQCLDAGMERIAEQPPVER